MMYSAGRGSAARATPVVQEENRETEAAALAREKKAAKKARRKERDAAVKATAEPPPLPADPIPAPVSNDGAHSSPHAAQAATAAPSAFSEAGPTASPSAASEDGRRAEAAVPSPGDGSTAADRYDDDFAMERAAAGSRKRHVQLLPAPVTAESVGVAAAHAADDETVG